jgi:hypothetical protein
MTTSLQKNELGALTIGADMSPFAISLPPNTEKMRINTLCTKECLSEVYFNFDNYTIFFIF